jgi:hypothetical protein
MADINTATSYQPGPAWTARSNSFIPQPSPSDPSCQPCPDCGGLECLCRPRFFAGQLLSEQDLNRLDYYIKAKNRLHNRYLFGSGVVCGLEVRCNPCSDVVTVIPGYALSPCGDDIIVCKTDTVDICSLIAKCRATTGPDCRPYSADQTDCADIEPWILAIRYEEKPARGITALTGGAKPNNCCACGKTDCSCKSAKTDCGCGGGSAAYSNGSTSAAASATTRAPRNAPPACEPTLTCEGYRYDVFRAPTGEEPGGGEMFQRMIACYLDLAAQLPQFPPGKTCDERFQNASAWSQWCYNVKRALIDYMATRGNYDCEAVYKLQAIACPPTDQGQQAFCDALDKLGVELSKAAGEALLACVCSAALPPCHDAGDPRVPLALVNVRRSDCSIVSVCDWTRLRRFVITFPTLRYWLGWLPYGRLIRNWMEAVCCNALGLPQIFPGGQLAATAAMGPDMAAGTTSSGAPASYATGTTGAGTTGGTGQDMFSQPLTFDFGKAGRTGLGTTVAQAVIHNLGSPAPTLTTGDLGQALFQPLDLTLPSVERLATQPAIKVLSEIIRPLTRGIPPALLQMGARPAPPARAAAPTAAAADVEELRARLTELQRTIAEQQAQIDALRRPPSDRRR